jgi:hypothetical protein
MILRAALEVSSLEVQQDTDSLIVKANAFWLRFERVVDRWRHVVESVPGGCWSLMSVEGGPDEPCPESPAFQDLWFEDRGGGGCEIQLMGQAGGTIYSAAVAVDESDWRITFDVCARRKRAGVTISAQSCYRVQPEQGQQLGTPWLNSRTLVLESDFPGEESRAMAEPVLWVPGGFVVGYPDRHCNVIAPQVSQWRWRYSLGGAKQG